MPTTPLKVFAFGYWGWGTRTSELVQRIDWAEKQAGFEPPLFVDTRIRRNARAVGFNGRAFEQLVSGRYEWMQGLGNLMVLREEPNCCEDSEGLIRRGKKILRSGAKPASHEESVAVVLAKSAMKADGLGPRICCPSDVGGLLTKVLNAAKENRRVIFFCACKDFAACHRSVIAELLEVEAKRRRKKIEVVEWPRETLQGPLPIERSRVRRARTIKSTDPAPSITRALSIRQPFAEQILKGLKTEEYRKTATHIRERVYIYAGKEEALVLPEEFRKVGAGFGQLPLGYLVGTVEIVGCELRQNHKGAYKYAWKLANPVRLKKPIQPDRTPNAIFFKPFDD